MRLRRELDALTGDSGLGQYKDMAEQLKQERDALSALEGKYTADHPKVLKSKRVIASLEFRLSGGIQDSAEVTPDNPAYLVLRSQLNATNADIRGNEENIKILTEKMERYEGYLSRAPQIEKEYQSLLRDYQNTRMEVPGDSGKENVS